MNLFSKIVICVIGIVELSRLFFESSAINDIQFPHNDFFKIFTTIKDFLIDLLGLNDQLSVLWPYAKNIQYLLLKISPSIDSTPIDAIIIHMQRTNETAPCNGYTNVNNVFMAKVHARYVQVVQNVLLSYVLKEVDHELD